MSVVDPAAPALPPVLLIGAEPAYTEAMTAELLRLQPGLDLQRLSRQSTDAELARCEVLLGWRLPAGLAARLPRLRWVCCTAAGVDKLLTPELPATVPVSRIVDEDQALGIAQYVALVVLSWARDLPQLQALQRDRQWLRHPMAAARQRVGVLGRGEIGRAIGQALAALGFPVRHWHREAGPLHAFLGGCEVLVNALPLTPQTDRLLDAAALAALPRGAYLVNIARGSHLVEADLIAALTAGHLSGAALDVQQHEPLPPDDPLWTTPGVLVTPHIAGQSTNDTVIRQFLAGLQALARGEAPPQQVDRQRGY